MKHEERLSETFESHEGQTPDAADVYARVEELSRSYKWRRRGVQVAGGVVVGAGLIAGFVKLPALLPSDPVAPATAGNAIVAAAPAVSPTPASDEEALKAYFAAGYDYDDALKLTKLWHATGDIASVKADAGRKLVAGEALPFPATPNPPVSEPPVDPQIEKDFAAFFNKGYVWDDAVKFAKLWKIKDPSDAKIAAGKKILAGQKLPFPPKPANVAQALENKRVEAFFTAKYDISDAEKLAKLWHTTTYKAKVEAGKRLISGQRLPIQP